MYTQIRPRHPTPLISRRPSIRPSVVSEFNTTIIICAHFACAQFVLHIIIPTNSTGNWPAKKTLTSDCVNYLSAIFAQATNIAFSVRPRSHSITCTHNYAGKTYKLRKLRIKHAKWNSANNPPAHFFRQIEHRIITNHYHWCSRSRSSSQFIHRRKSSSNRPPMSCCSRSPCSRAKTTSPSLSSAKPKANRPPSEYHDTIDFDVLTSCHCEYPLQCSLRRSAMCRNVATCLNHPMDYLIAILCRQYCIPPEWIQVRWWHTQHEYYVLLSHGWQPTVECKLIECEGELLGMVMMMMMYILFERVPSYVDVWITAIIIIVWPLVESSRENRVSLLTKLLGMFHCCGFDECVTQTEWNKNARHECGENEPNTTLYSQHYRCVFACFAYLAFGGVHLRMPTCVWLPSQHIRTTMMIVRSSVLPLELTQTDCRRRRRTTHIVRCGFLWIPRRIAAHRVPRLIKAIRSSTAHGVGSNIVHTHTIVVPSAARVCLHTMAEWWASVWCVVHRHMASGRWEASAELQL